MIIHRKNKHTKHTDDKYTIVKTFIMEDCHIKDSEIAEMTGIKKILIHHYRLL